MTAERENEKLPTTKLATSRRIVNFKKCKFATGSWLSVLKRCTGFCLRNLYQLLAVGRLLVALHGGDPSEISKQFEKAGDAFLEVVSRPKKKTEGKVGR